jgi:hypothetical protein
VSAHEQQARRSLSQLVGRPRFHAEYFIFQYREELNRYSIVFHERIVTSFAGLNDEAKIIQDKEYERLGEYVDPEYADPDYGMEEAFHAGVEFYLTTDAVRQGIYNLMSAGIFHLLEQQAQYLATRVLANPVIQPDRRGGFSQLKTMLNGKFGINIESFKCWSQLNELRLVANTVKHGDGRSSAELKALNPDLFKDPQDPFPHIASVPLRPLVGEGLRLSADHFDTYTSCVEQFWHEIVEALYPIFDPHLGATTS